nr:YlcI/YnfO family protein [uncultured Oscillibacter sp.]
MARKFKIPAIPKTTPKNIRFPNDVIEDVEKAIQGTDSTFSAFVIAATKWALESLEEDAPENG